MSQISPERLMAIIAMQSAIARSPAELDSVMAVVVDRAMALTGADGAVLELVEGDMTSYRSGSGTAREFVGFKMPREGSLSGLCLRQRIALQSPDTSVDDRVDRQACERIGVASMVCVPLFHEGEAVGVLKVLSRRTHAFDDATSAILTLLAEVIAAAMHHAREHEAAVELSLHDGLTGLLNRRAFDRQLTQEMARSQRYNRPLSLVMFDLDGLKTANDTLGHAAGDAILRDTGAILLDTLRINDGCFRIGGDEFAAILPETDEEHACRAVERCVVALAAARLGDGRVGVSAGVAEHLPGESPEAIVQRADAALYEDKRRNQEGSSTNKTTLRIRRAR